MAATKQTQAIAMANEALGYAAALGQLTDNINSFVARYNNQATSTVWNALATAGVNADGTLGAADGAPNNAHPISTAVYPALNRAVAANDMVTFVALLQAFQNFMGNVNVPTANRRQVVDPLVGG